MTPTGPNPTHIIASLPEIDGDMQAAAIRDCAVEMAKQAVRDGALYVIKGIELQGVDLEV